MPARAAPGWPGAPAAATLASVGRRRATPRPPEIDDEAAGRRARRRGSRRRDTDRAGGRALAGRSSRSDRAASLRAPSRATHRRAAAPASAGIDAQRRAAAGRTSAASAADDDRCRRSAATASRGRRRPTSADRRPRRPRGRRRCPPSERDLVAARRRSRIANDLSHSGVRSMNVLPTASNGRCGRRDHDRDEVPDGDRSRGGEQAADRAGGRPARRRPRTAGVGRRDRRATWRRVTTGMRDPTAPG